VVNNQLNLVKLGATRPLPFQLFDISGMPVPSLSLCNSFTFTPSLGNVCNDSPAVSTPWVNLSFFVIGCPNSAPINTGTDTTVSFPGNSAIQNNGGGNFQVNWQTKGLPLSKGSCANVVATFDFGLKVVPATIGFQFN